MSYGDHSSEPEEPLMGATKMMAGMGTSGGLGRLNAPVRTRDRTPLAGEYERLSAVISTIEKVAEELQQRLAPLLLAGPPFPPGISPEAVREKGVESQLSLALRERTERLEIHARWLAELISRLDV